MEDKIQKLVDFAISFKDDPDFGRLTFPADVWKRLAPLGIKPAKKEYSITQAVDKCFSLPNTEQYTTNTIETIDQTLLSVTFPTLPESASSTDTSETKTQPLEDSPSPRKTDAVEDTKTDDEGPLSS